MIKHFCDVCGSMITHENTIVVPDAAGFIRTRISLPLSPDITTDVTAPQSAPNTDADPVDVCLHCVLDAMARLDNRVARA